MAPFSIVDLENEAAGMGLIFKHVCKTEHTHISLASLFGTLALVAAMGEAWHDHPSITSSYEWLVWSLGCGPAAGKTGMQSCSAQHCCFCKTIAGEGAMHRGQGASDGQRARHSSKQLR